MTLLEECKYIDNLDNLIARGKYSTIDIDTLNDMYERLEEEISLMKARLSRIDLAVREAEMQLWEEEQKPEDPCGTCIYNYERGNRNDISRI